jgi:chloramphenicol 3-O-phosphotransferase
MAAHQGNQNAKKAKRFESAITRALAKIAEGAGVEAGIDKLAEKLVASAQAGEQWALQEVANRLDGKPAQSVTVGGDEENPIQISAIAIKLVKADGA